MFANALRSQARLGLRTALRTALPATRTLSALAGTQVAVPAPSSLARLVVSSRAFSQSAPVLYENSENIAESDTIFVGSLPWSATKEEIQEVFSEFGPVVNVRIQTAPDGRPRGFAHVSFENVKNAVAAVLSATEEPIHLGGRDLNVNFAKTRADVRANNEPNEKIYFSGCVEGEAALRELMRDLEGDIVNIHFLRDKDNGELLSTGFVEFSTIQTATDAIKRFDATEMEGGVKLFLSYARPKRQRSERQGSSYGDRRSREPFKPRSYRPQQGY